MRTIDEKKMDIVMQSDRSSLWVGQDSSNVFLSFMSSDVIGLIDLRISTTEINGDF